MSKRQFTGQVAPTIKRENPTRSMRMHGRKRSSATADEDSFKPKKSASVKFGGNLFGRGNR